MCAWLYLLRYNPLMCISIQACMHVLPSLGLLVEQLFKFCILMVESLFMVFLLGLGRKMLLKGDRRY